MNNPLLGQKRAYVLGLFVDCPFGPPLDTCPVKGVRELPMKDRFALLNKMDESQLDELIEWHRNCLGERESGD